MIVKDIIYAMLHQLSDSQVTDVLHYFIAVGSFAALISILLVIHAFWTQHRCEHDWKPRTERCPKCGVTRIVLTK